MAPNPLVPLQRIDCQVTTDSGAYAGSAGISSDGRIQIAFPDAQPVRSLRLRGFDGAGVLRAGGELDAAGLAVPVPRIRFTLYEQFEAFTDSIASPRFNLFAMVSSNEVLGLGGEQDGSTSIPVVRFDPRDGIISAAGTLRYPRYQFSSAFQVTDDGRAFLAGGFDFGADTSAEIYDPSTETSSTTEDLYGPTGRLSAARIPQIVRTGPNVYWVIGGPRPQPPVPATAADVIDLSDPLTGFQQSLTQFAPAMFEALFAHRVEPQGYLMFASWGGLGNNLQDAVGRTYQSDMSAFTSQFSTGVTAIDEKVTHLYGPRKSVLLGTSNPQTCDSVLVISSNGLPGSETLVPLPRARCNPMAAWLGSAKVLFFGGTDGVTGTVLDGAEILDTEAMIFSTAFDPAGIPVRLHSPKSAGAAVTLPDGSIVEIGGEGPVASDPVPMFEIYVPRPLQ